jgi:uncharacterized protein YjbI with pentapeptide repeats
MVKNLRVDKLQQTPEAIEKKSKNSTELQYPDWAPTKPKGRWQSLKDKTAWEWLDLLVVPIFLAGIAYLLNIQVADRQLIFQSKLSKIEQETEKTRYNYEQQITLDRYRQDTLSSYINNISKLITEKNVDNQTLHDNSNEIKVMETMTLTNLQELDGNRKGLLIRFLYKSGLISFEEPRISLEDADLRGADLQGADLQGVDFRDADLQRADLRGANLTDANLVEANFVLASLTKANLRGAKLHNAIFRYANLQHATYSPETEGIEDLDTSVRGKMYLVKPESNLRDANLKDAFLSQSDLRGADLIGADLTKADLRGAKLANAKLHEANLSSADLSKAVLSEAIFNNALLLSSNLRVAALNNAELFDADLSRASFMNSDLSGAYLNRAILSGADLRKANLSGAVLSSSNLENANLSGANLIDANLVLAKLNKTNLEHALYSPDTKGLEDLEDSVKEKMYFIAPDSNLRDADLNGGSDLSNADLRCANLIDVNLVLAKLNKTNLEHALYSPDTKGLEDLEDSVKEKMYFYCA